MKLNTILCGFEENLPTIRHRTYPPFLYRSFKKELNQLEATTASRQKKKAEQAEQKRLAAIQLSNYKYEAPDLEVKLSDELTGNLRNLKPEGSLLVDRYGTYLGHN